MKQKKFNTITSGASGKFGDECVYRIRDGKTIICKPQPPRPGPGTPNQQKARQAMIDANAYARRMKQEPAIRQLYLAAAKGDLNENSLAVRDFFRAPVINEIDPCAYSGGPGSYLTIFAKDDFMVSQVTVHIYDTFNHLVETGLAVAVNKDEFRYHATAQCMDRNGCHVVVTATDLPGNAVVKTVDIPGAMLVVPVEVIGWKEEESDHVSVLTPEHVPVGDGKKGESHVSMLTPEHIPVGDRKQRAGDGAVSMLTPEHIPVGDRKQRAGDGHVSMLTPEHVSVDDRKQRKSSGHVSMLTPEHIPVGDRKQRAGDGDVSMLTPEHIPVGDRKQRASDGDVSMLTPEHIPVIMMNTNGDTLQRVPEDETNEAIHPAENIQQEVTGGDELLIASLKLTALFEEDTETETPVSPPAPVFHLLFQQSQPAHSVVHQYIVPTIAPAAGIDISTGPVTA